MLELLVLSASRGIMFWCLSGAFTEMASILGDGSERATVPQGLSVYTDPVTGVEYVSSTDGVLTPRLNDDGTLRVRGVAR